MTQARNSSWSDFVRLMHLPLPFCVLAFATIGAAFSEHVHLYRLAITYAGIVLALCFGAYSLDELHGRPYHTQFSDRTLSCMAIIGLSGGAIIAAYLTLTVSPLISIFAALAAFFILAYNLELWNGRFHNAGWFGLSWGGLTTFASYFVQAGTLGAPPLLASVMSSLVGVSIVYLTHKFRREELATKLQTIPAESLQVYSRYSRKTAWAIARLECYAMMSLAIGMIIPKITVTVHF